MSSAVISRTLIIAVFAASCGLSTFAIVQAAPDPARQAAAPLKSVEVGRVFPYLDKYLSLPAAERSHFKLSYSVRVEGRPIEGQAWIQHGLRRVEVPIGPGGRVERLPSLAEIQAKDRIVFDLPATTKMSVSLSPELATTPGTEVSASDVLAGIEQANAAIHRFAGVLGFAAPHITRAVFIGASSGTAVDAQGRLVPLPTDEHGATYFDPAKTKNARSLRFAKAPSRAALE